jgi:hypothetical protein
MTKVTEITAFKLSDGRIIEDFETALYEEKFIEFKKQVAVFASNNGTCYETKDAIMDAIIENVDRLKEIFSILD